MSLLRKHGHNFAPYSEDDTHEGEISCGDDAHLPKAARISEPSDATTLIQGVATCESEARLLWRTAKCVCFDVDSTVCIDEAIDEVAAFCGVGEEVKTLTRRAMSEGFSFREALEKRLDLIKPGRPLLDRYLREHPPKFTPGIKEVVAELQRRNVPVYLVSGGFTKIILDVAKVLNVPEENVYANVLHFDEQGEYAGFDESQPTSDSGGKPKVCGMLKSKFRYSPLIMVGDGATDMEAAPPADAFIGFGGNVKREAVEAGAPWYVTNFQELLDELMKQ